MTANTNKEKILFLDIETVPQCPEFEKLSPRMQELWAKKTQYQRKEEETPALYYNRAGIYAEFGKIVCISVGFFAQNIPERIFRVKSFASDDEKQILSDFTAMLNSHFNGKDNTLCAHNGKEFDFPYIARRILIHGLPLPEILSVSGKKPWETPFIDTLEMWKFGDYKNYISLELMAALFDIPTPKDDIDGSQVHRVYWQEHDLPRITRYCMKDVVTLASVYLRLKSEPALSENEVRMM